LGVSLAASAIEHLDFGLHQTLSLPQFQGLVWTNAEPVSDPDVRALIGGTDCTGPAGVIVTDQSPASYFISVASASVIPGCGERGEQIRFTINGHLANETAMWSAVDIPLFRGDGTPVPLPTLPPPPAISPLLANRHGLDLTIGPPFAVFFPQVYQASGQIELGASLPVEAYIAGTLCGRVEAAGAPLAFLVVLPRELRPACGFEGAVITFRIGGVEVSETAVWHAGRQDGPRLTRRTAVSSILPPTVGEAGMK
jgi:hypothetical protein